MRESTPETSLDVVLTNTNRQLRDAEVSLDRLAMRRLELLARRKRLQGLRRETLRLLGRGVVIREPQPYDSLRVDCDSLRPHVEAALSRMTTKDLGLRSDVSDRTIRGICDHTAEHVTLTTADRLLTALGLTDVVGQLPTLTHKELVIGRARVRKLALTGDDRALL